MMMQSVVCYRTKGDAKPDGSVQAQKLEIGEAVDIPLQFTAQILKLQYSPFFKPVFKN